MEGFEVGKAFVTGGAGFIGSHLVDELVRRGAKVTVYDNLSTGRREVLKEKSSSADVKLIEGDILDLEFLKESMRGHDIVFHLAANADVRGGIHNTRVDLEQNIIGTHNVLEAMRENAIKRIAFTSSATVYGEPKQFPTPETYPAIQTSLYGASKLAGGALIQAYSEAFGMTSWIFRFVSILCERYSHGVVFDFMKKLRKNPRSLEILGDGKQRKSYLYVGDCIAGIMMALEKSSEKVNIFNLGHTEFLDVCKVADIIVSELGLEQPEYTFTGGTRGWIGDSPFVHLSVEKMQKLGWQPKIEIEDAIRRTVRYLQEHPVT